MVMALKPLYDMARIKRLVVSTYQAVSGAGKEGIDELTRTSTKAYSEGREMEAHILPSASLAQHYPIAFNLIPQIDVFLDNLYTKEEMKMVNGTIKLCMMTICDITVTTERVPVYRSHSETINIEFEHDLNLADMAQAIDAFPGVQMLDDPQIRFILCLYIPPENTIAMQVVCAVMNPIPTALTCGLQVTKSVRVQHSIHCRLPKL